MNPPMDGCISVASVSDMNPHALIPTSSLQLGRTTLDRVDAVDESPDNYRLSGRSGRFCQNTQLYEGTNQVQRVVVAKHLLK
jgi:hypothetical protein